MEAEGKIFHNESHDVEDETKWLEEIIEAAISRCKDELQVEDCNPNLSVKDNDSKFYKKLLSLLNGVPEDMSALANDSAGTPNVFELSTSSVEKGESERELVRIVKQREEKYHEALTKYEKERIKLREKIETLRKSLTETEEILNDVSTEYCELKEEIERIKKEAFFKEVPQLSRNTSSTPDRTDRQVIAEESSSRAELSLVTVPTDTVEREVHNNYKLLLLRASQMLLRDEKEKLRSWAASGYSVEISGDVFQILAELDKKGIISSSNLTVLKTFFEEIMRIDLVFIIENFLAGEYSLLRNVQSLTKENNRNRGDMAPRRNEGRPFGIPPPVTSEISNPIISVEEIAVDLKGASARQNVPQERYAPARGQLIAESDLYSTGIFLRKLMIYNILVSTYRDKREHVLNMKSSPALTYINYLLADKHFHVVFLKKIVTKNAKTVICTVIRVRKKFLKFVRRILDLVVINIYISWAGDKQLYIFVNINQQSEY